LVRRLTKYLTNILMYLKHFVKMTLPLWKL